MAMAIFFSRFVKMKNSGFCVYVQAIYVYNNETYNTK